MVFAQDSDAAEQQLAEHRGRPFRGIGVAGPHGDRVPGAEHVGVIGALDADAVGEQFLEQFDRLCSLAIPVCPGGVLLADTQCLVMIGPVHPREVVPSSTSRRTASPYMRNSPSWMAAWSRTSKVSGWSAPSRATQSSSTSRSRLVVEAPARRGEHASFAA